MKILIDGRLYGLENAGLGRYVMNLIDQISETDHKNDYLILLRKKYFLNLKLPSNFKKILFDSHHYSFSEQIRLPFMLNKINPDLSHFPHFNVPIFYNGKYIVTIHDMLMHNQRGFEATTLNPIKYLVKRIAYKIVFKTAVMKSKKIIVPSNAIKNELISFYKISSDKVEVIYEG